MRRRGDARLPSGSGGGYRSSRFNSLRYGVMVDGVLPSRGSERCVYADRCPSTFRCRCVAGEPCAHETYLLNGFLHSAATQYAYAKAWLTPQEFEQIIHQLAVLSLQMARLSARIATEVPFEQGLVTDGISGPLTGISIGRYATALHRRQHALTLKLLDSETWRSGPQRNARTPPEDSWRNK